MRTRWVGAVIATLVVVACGEDGVSALLSTETESAGVNCPFGGLRVETGIDENGNGVLDDAEVTATSYVCNGENGQDGDDANAYGALKAACAAGGLYFEDFRASSPLIDQGGDVWRGSLDWWFPNGEPPTLAGDYLLLKSTRTPAEAVAEEAQSTVGFALADVGELVIGAWSNRWPMHGATPDVWVDTSIGAEFFGPGGHEALVVTHGSFGVFLDTTGDCGVSPCQWKPIAGWDLLRQKHSPIAFQFRWEAPASAYDMALYVGDDEFPRASHAGVDFVTSTDLRVRLNANVTDTNSLPEDEEILFIDYICVR